MTEFNKGDIVYPTAEYQERVREACALEGEQDYRDDYVLSGAPLRIVGETQPIGTPAPLFPGFIVAVSVDSERTDFNEDDFLAGASEDYADVYLLLADEVQHEGGVLAGV